MNTAAVTVVYQWNANPGKLDQLVSIYERVTQAMNDNEPGATAVHLHVDRAAGSLLVRDEFANAEAVGFHLGTTAASHFPELLQVATPGPFFFLGDVPEPLQAATRQMGLQATFAPHATGFDRAEA